MFQKQVDPELDSINGSQYSGYQRSKLLARVIKLAHVKPYKIQEVLQEASFYWHIIGETNHLIEIKGVRFNEKEQTLHIYMPQRVSLHSIIHNGNRGPGLRSIEKLLIAKKIAKALY
jgi:hypothetical protein